MDSFPVATQRLRRVAAVAVRRRDTVTPPQPRALAAHAPASDRLGPVLFQPLAGLCGGRAVVWESDGLDLVVFASALFLFGKHF